jgi:hypothetical protein
MSDQNFEQESFQFDKFMKDFEDKDTQKRDDHKDRAGLAEENLNLEYFKRFQEDWRNSTRWRR